MENLAITERDCEQFQRVVPLKIGGTSVIQFSDASTQNPGLEQLMKDLHRYRSTKQVLKQLFIEGQTMKPQTNAYILNFLQRNKIDLYLYGNTRT